MKSGHYTMATSPYYRPPKSAIATRNELRGLFQSTQSLWTHLQLHRAVELTTGLRQRRGLVDAHGPRQVPNLAMQLAHATVSASTSPMRPTPGRRLKLSENTWLHMDFYRENDDSLEKNHATLFSDKWIQMEFPSAPVTQ